MLPKENRLVSDFDFRRVRKFGRLYHSPFFSLYSLKEKNLQPSRFGFVVSTKVSKSAVKRNALKRLLRLPVEENLSKVTPGISAAFWVRGRALTSPAPEVSQAVFLALKQMGILARE
ncbi:MAG: ribonuclease P protein component [Patescibacteria group bacterium]